MEGVRPKISIIVPVYLSEPFLNQCVESLISQTLKEIEIILVNDGSPDNSLKICEYYSFNDQRVKIIDKKNGGAADALNRGTYAAEGDYLMYLDADDWVEQETCEEALKAAVSYNADIVIWSYLNEYQNKTSKAIPEYDSVMVFESEYLLNLRRRMIGLVGSELKNPIRTDSINAGWAKLYRRTLFADKINYWVNSDIIGSSDVFFNIQIFSKSHKVVYINKFYNHYRRSNPNSLTANYNDTLFQKSLRLFELIENFISINKLGIEFNNALNNRIALSTINNVLSICSPKNSSSNFEKLKNIKKVLNNPIYNTALVQLELKYIPFHWLLFFFVAKVRFAFGVYLLGLLMNKFRK